MKKFIIFLFSIVWLCACSNDLDTDVPIGNETDNNSQDLGFSDKDVVKGRMRIKLKEEPTGQISIRSVGGQVITGIRALDGSATALGITRIERTFPYAGKYEERTRREGLHLWYDVWYSKDIATTRAVGNVLNLDDIAIVCPVPQIKLHAAPMPSPLVESLLQNTVDGTTLPWNDPEQSKQWNLYNSGTESWQIAGSDIRLAEVWKQYNGNPNIIIAVVDEGVDWNHLDLKDNIWTNTGEIAGNEIDDDGNGFIDDVHGFNFVNNNGTITPYDHGTHVAGIIGATNNNGKGVCGIAGGDGTPNSGVKIMCCQILESYNQKAEGSPNAIKYAADNGAVICQNSWGYTGNIKTPDKDAIDYFIKYAGCDNAGNQLPNSPMKGGIVLFATNNNNSSAPSDATPADYEKVVGVAAIRADYQKGSYSDYGDYIDICAPGGDKFHTGESIYSTTASSSYGYLYGASMACPHVSSVAALVIEKYGVGKPGFTADQLTEILLKSTYDIDAYNPKYIGKLGSGCISATRALQANLPESKEFTLKPNPVTNGILLIKVNTEWAGKATVIIYNSIGSKVFRQSIETKRHISSSLNISKLAAGYYTMEYICNGNSIREKFIKY